MTCNKIVTYDNPATFYRECWQDGELIYALSASCIITENYPPAELFFFGANVGQWVEGQHFGDLDAMNKGEDNVQLV